MTDQHDQVRKYYAEIARAWQEGISRSCCSTTDCCASNATIPLEALAARADSVPLPGDIVQTSLGCGTPLDLAALKPGETVLDLGSGGGLDCFLAARLVGPTGRVIGVDMTSEMLALAKANQARLGLPNVEFRYGYLEALPLDDASVDVIISNCVINLAPDKEAVFREAYRVLKPGRRVVWSDLFARVPLPQELRQNAAAWAECVGGAITPDEYVAKMTRAGFRNIRVYGTAAPEDLIFSAKVCAWK